MWASLQSWITLRYFSSKVAPCRSNKRNKRAGFLLSADKERTVAKEKKWKKRAKDTLQVSLSHSRTHTLFSSFGNQKPSWHRRGPLNWKLCSYSNTPDIRCCFSTHTAPCGLLPITCACCIWFLETSSTIRSRYSIYVNSPANAAAERAHHTE